MSTHRSRRAARKNAPRSSGGSAAIQLAPGVRLGPGAEHGHAPILISANGHVQLNERAAAILRLCDGSRARADIVAEIVRTSATHTRTEDVHEFLDAATARGWIVETLRRG